MFQPPGILPATNCLSQSQINQYQELISVTKGDQRLVTKCSGAPTLLEQRILTNYNIINYNTYLVDLQHAIT